MFRRYKQCSCMNNNYQNNSCEDNNEFENDMIETKFAEILGMFVGSSSRIGGRLIPYAAKLFSL